MPSKPIDPDDSKPAPPETPPETAGSDVGSRFSRRHARGEDAAIRRFTLETAQLLHDRHCQDVRVLDVRGLSDLTDYILIASGTSDRQIRSVAEEVAESAKTVGLTTYGHEGEAVATWVVLDFVDLIVHLFEPDTRAHYDLEMLWGDAPKLAWQRGR